ncbi:hypothetical protein PM082_024349 [Marasmius tenuissimus]|nr:hypothetical protein PM082_024349 [Marasmius tenuissimus]
MSTNLPERKNWQSFHRSLNSPAHLMHNRDVLLERSAQVCNIASFHSYNVENDPSDVILARVPLTYSSFPVD